MRKTIPEYTNSQMNALIDEHVHNIRNRAILKMRFLDGMTYDRIADELDMSPQQIKTIIYKTQQKLLKHL